MPSVIIEWNGSLPDRVAQEDLLERLRDFAVLTQFHYSREHPAAPAAPEVKHYNGTLRGTILIDPGLLPGGSLDSQECLRAPQVSVRGVEFRVADCRHLYPGDDRVSFVFAHVPSNRALDGVLVMVHQREDCDYFLTSPRIHLRVDFEEWMDGFLAWIKHFHIPNLAYWRYGSNPGFENMRQWPRDNDMRDLLWDWLRLAFEAEAQRRRPEAAWIRDLLDSSYAGIVESARPFHWLRAR
jgi:hypothetical protein